MVQHVHEEIVAQTTAGSNVCVMHTTLSLHVGMLSLHDFAGMLVTLLAQYVLDPMTPWRAQKSSCIDRRYLDPTHSRCMHDCIQQLTLQLT